MTLPAKGTNDCNDTYRDCSAITMNVRVNQDDFVMICIEVFEWQNAA